MILVKAYRVQVVGLMDGGAAFVVGEYLSTREIYVPLFTCGSLVDLGPYTVSSNL